MAVRKGNGHRKAVERTTNGEFESPQFNRSGGCPGGWGCGMKAFLPT